MKVFVTLQIKNGTLTELLVWEKDQDAKRWERQWLKIHSLKNRQEREALSENGLDFISIARETR